MFKKRPIINYFLDWNVPKYFNYNYINIVKNDYKSFHKIREINAYLFWEALLIKCLGRKVPEPLAEQLKTFGNKDSMFAWWPELELKNGKKYFINWGAFGSNQSYDYDDTAVANKYYGRLLKDQIVSNFIHVKPLEDKFTSICSVLNCRREFIVEMFSDPKAYNHIDLVCTANFITSLDLKSSFQKEVFKENSLLINGIIERPDFKRYLIYWEPKVSGVFLMLFYHIKFQQYLTVQSVKILEKFLKENHAELKTAIVGARWGGNEKDKPYFFEYDLLYENRHLGPLMHECAIKFIF